MKKYIQPQFKVYEIVRDKVCGDVLIRSNGEYDIDTDVKEEQPTQSMWDLYE